LLSSWSHEFITCLFWAKQPAKDRAELVRLMIGNACLLVAVCVWLAAMGRGSIPKEERLPLRSWSSSDLARNIILGARHLARLHQRNPLTPHLKHSQDI